MASKHGDLFHFVNVFGVGLLTKVIISIEFIEASPCDLCTSRHANDVIQGMGVFLIFKMATSCDRRFTQFQQVFFSFNNKTICKPFNIPRNHSKVGSVCGIIRGGRWCYEDKQKVHQPTCARVLPPPLKKAEMTSL